MRSLVAVIVVAACGNQPAPGSPTPDAAAPADAAPDALPPVPTPVFTQTAYIKSSTPLHDSRFGASALSGDGRTLVGSYAGVVTVYERDPIWRMTGDITPSTPIADFGSTVAISSDGLTIAVGARSGYPVGTDGGVYVFRKAGTSWTQQTRIEVAMPSALALTADGNTLAVASGNRVATYVYAQDQWTLAGAAGGGSNDHMFGATLALANDSSVLVASVYHSKDRTVQVFERAGAEWLKRATLATPLNPPESDFGISVACSAQCETIAIGDLQPGGLPTPSGPTAHTPGVAFVFNRDGATWAHTQTLRATNEGIWDQFGRAIAISSDGKTIVVGAPGEHGVNDAHPYAGAAYVYRQHYGMWREVLFLKGSNTAMIDTFGSALAVSDDGTTIVGSAFGENSASPGVDGDQTDESQPYAGAAYVFEGTY